VRRYRLARRARIPAALAIALVLAGCGGAVDTASSLLGTKSRPCPRALLVGDAQRLIDLAPGPVSAESVRLTARVTLPVAECDYEDDKILVDLSVPIDAKRGPQLPRGSLQFDLRYFVAVTDRFGKVLGKRIFATELTMGGDEQRTSQLDGAGAWRSIFVRNAAESPPLISAFWRITSVSHPTPDNDAGSSELLPLALSSHSGSCRHTLSCQLRRLLRQLRRRSRVLMFGNGATGRLRDRRISDSVDSGASLRWPRVDIDILDLLEVAVQHAQIRLRLVRAGKIPAEERDRRGR
jgi:hypothetical protein